MPILCSQGPYPLTEGYLRALLPSYVFTTVWRHRTWVRLRLQKTVGSGASISPQDTLMVRRAPASAPLESSFQEVPNQGQLEVVVPPTSEEIGTS